MCISNRCMRTTWNNTKMQQKDTIWGIWSHITLHLVFSMKLAILGSTQVPDPRAISDRGLEIWLVFWATNWVSQCLNYDSYWKMKRLNIWSMRMNGGARVSVIGLGRHLWWSWFFLLKFVCLGTPISLWDDPSHSQALFEDNVSWFQWFI